MVQRVRVFVASPGDVTFERDALATVITDMNLAVDALAPDSVVLELVRWETHVHPDVGRDQQVVTDQLPDYDIFVGIMWKRFGTPTGEADSGTEEEFREALALRSSGEPLPILFYFSGAGYSMEDDVEQVAKVKAFRDELQGLVRTYPGHEEFANVVRRDLFNVVGRIINRDRAELAAEARRSAPVGEATAILEPKIYELAREYERLREQMESGDERTRRMEVVASRMRALAADVYPLLGALSDSTAPGDRLAAVSLLQAVPHPDYLAWLAQRFEPGDADGLRGSEKPFIQYHAAVALLTAITFLGDEHQSPLVDALTRTRQAYGSHPGQDRDAVLWEAERQLGLDL